MKTAELIGPALDWAVAKCENREWPDNAAKFLGEQYYKPSTDWDFGGPIIEREGISLLHKTHNREWHATIHRPDRDLPNGLRVLIRWHTSDPLIAAMRCYVASRLGDEVDIPEELK